VVVRIKAEAQHMAGDAEPGAPRLIGDPLDVALAARGEAQHGGVDERRVTPRQIQQRGLRREPPSDLPGGHRAAISALTTALEGKGPRNASADMRFCSSVSDAPSGARWKACQSASTVGAGASLFSFSAVLLMERP